jgi:hypothetical protein
MDGNNMNQVMLLLVGVEQWWCIYVDQSVHSPSPTTLTGLIWIRIPIFHVPTYSHTCILIVVIIITSHHIHHEGPSFTFTFHFHPIHSHSD